MTTSVNGEHNFARLSFVITAGIGFVFGLLIHSFIVAVNIMDWLKRRPVAMSDQVIASLGMSRLIFQFACLFHMFFAIFVDNNYLNFFLIIMKVISNYSSIWLMTLLSVVYCSKISNFQNAFFRTLKTIVFQKAVHFIAGSVIVALFCGALQTLFDLTADLTNSTKAFTVTGTQRMQRNLKYFTFFILGNTVPFLIYFLASLLVIFFLCLHMREMKTNSNYSFKLNTYFTAFKAVTYCFLCYALHVGSNLIALYYVDSLSIVWVNVILNIFPALHSVILIYKTPNLKTQFLRLF